jgi:hypothetical protein
VPATPTHPARCEYQLAPCDETHTHTAAVGATHIARNATIELVLIQPPDVTQPVLTLHIVAGSTRLSLNLVGEQAWALAGVLIDATVAHAQAARISTALPPSAPPQAEPAVAPDDTGRRLPLWLLDRHPGRTMPRARTGHRSFRCRPNTVQSDNSQHRDDEGSSE